VAGSILGRWAIPGRVGFCGGVALHLAVLCLELAALWLGACGGVGRNAVAISSF